MIQKCAAPPPWWDVCPEDSTLPCDQTITSIGDLTTCVDTSAEDIANELVCQQYPGAAAAGIACPPAEPTPTPTSTPRYVDNGNGTVTDAQTGLQWEKKTTLVDSGANPADLHYVDNLYVWAGWCALSNGFCQPTPEAVALCRAQILDQYEYTAGCGDCPVLPFENPCIISYAVTTVWEWLHQVRDEGFAGHGDWRLPTVNWGARRS